MSKSEWMTDMFPGFPDVSMLKVKAADDNENELNDVLEQFAEHNDTDPNFPGLPLQRKKRETDKVTLYSFT